MSKDSVKSRHFQVNVIAERCKGCSFCIEFCPQHIIRESSEINSKGYHIVVVDDNDKCNGCDICSMICPDFAISVVSIEEKTKEGVEIGHV
ncbi:unnamed protein product [marine sediment metagenome]|uniref:4Fe-4S ferredoxin-type domain-containing protein n=1 Tax=marine sediment metagenome TaxID=412755 RepID=X1NX55_9ZZZZ